MTSNDFLLTLLFLSCVANIGLLIVGYVLIDMLESALNERQI